MKGKEIIQLLASYNRKANAAMLAILKKLPEEELGRDLGNYFKSIRELLAHVALADLNWFKRTRNLVPNPALDASDLVSIETQEIAGRLKEDFAYAAALIERIDVLFEDYAAALVEEDLPKRIRFKNMRGQELEKTYWHTILHILNHGTHHRGALSSMLDSIKADNDYSGIQLYTD
jgi:uncharacterized damage-inducible protein DinB